MNAISDIQKRILANRKHDRWEGYVRMLKILKTAFSSERHWILEFLQNAEDAEAKRFTIKISNDGLLILNDGHPFKEDKEHHDVNAICDVNSRKLIHLGFKGWLGVGFKSIFRVSSRVELHSGEFHFAFDRQYWAKRNWEGAPSGADFPWEILPVECPPLKLPDPYTTGFWIPATQEVKPTLARLAEFFGSDLFPSEIVLLLAHIEAISVHLTNGTLYDKKRVLEERDCVTGPAQPKEQKLKTQIALVAVTGEGGLARRSSEKSYLVIRADRKVPDRVKNSPEAEELRRSKVDERELGLVFGLEKDKGGLHPLSSRLGGVYSFLPLEAEQTGLPFGVFGDFVPHPNRVAVNEGLLWNHWLCDEIVQVLEQSIKHIFITEERWKFAPSHLFAWLQEPYSGTSLWVDRVREPIKQFLNEGEFYPDTDGVLHRLSDLMIVDDDLEEALGEDALQALLRGKHPAHPDVANKLGSLLIHVNLYDLLQNHHNVLKKLGPERIAKVYSLASDSENLSDYFVHGRKKNGKPRDKPLENVPFVRGSDGNHHAPNRVVHVDLELPSLPTFAEPIVKEIVKEAEATLDPLVARNEGALQGLRRCGLTVIDKQTLIYEIQRRIESVYEKNDCPPDWSFPEDLISATLFVAKENQWFRPSRLVSDDGHLYDVNSLFMRTGPLNWSAAHDQGLLAGYFALHAGYTSEPALAQLELDLPTLRERLQNMGIHGFDAVKDRTLTERAGYAFATMSLQNSEGHHIQPVHDRDLLGYDLQCVRHCKRVFEVKNMTRPDNISLEPSEVNAAKGFQAGYLLDIVYAWPDNPILKQLINPSLIWEPVERARISIEVWQRSS